MTTKVFDVKKAREQVRKESVTNAPKNAPYSASVVKARELLLIAQSLLSKYEAEKSADARKTLAISFEKTMRKYKQMIKDLKRNDA